MKRYDSYKDSGVEWIGEIPSRWELSRIRYYIDYQKGKNPKEFCFIENTNTKIYLTMDYLRGNPKQILFVENSEEYLEVENNQILLLWDGSNAGEFVLSKEGILSSTMAVLNIRHLQKEFSWYYLKYFEIYLRESTIGMGVPHVNGGELKNSYIIIPPILEQTAIASFLDRKTTEIDQLITNKKRLIELYEEEKTAIINRAVTKGIDPDVKLKDSGIEWLGEIPEHWEVKRMKNICSVRQGLQIPIEKRHLTQVDNSFEYITIKSINNPEHPKEYIAYPSKNVICSSDDILMARTGATGEPIINVEGVFHNNFFLIDYDRGVADKKFLYYFFKSIRIKEYLLLVAGTTTIPDLNHSEFYNTPFFKFSKKEQRFIINHIETACSRINSKISKTKNLIDLLLEYRTTLISEVVTGKIKVV